MPSHHDAARGAPSWIVWSLRAAAIYNVVWGALVIAFPGLVFEIASIEPPRYPQIWQCVGMIVGVYGIGYWIASTDPRRHWPIVLVGLLGKVLGPIGFAWALVEGSLPIAFGATIVTNDLVWWVPFLLILWDAARAQGSDRPPRVELEDAMRRVPDQHGRTLDEISAEAPVLLVCTRHAGCTFCKEALADLGRRRQRIIDRGYSIGVVSMSDADVVARQAARFGLPDIHVFSDPDRHLYQALDLERGTVMQLLGPVVWWRGFLALFRGHLPGPLDGDGFQMPGAFIVHDGRVVRAFRHRRASDRIDVDEMTCEIPA